MEEFEEFLASIPEKIVDYKNSQQRLDALLKSLNRSCKFSSKVCDSQQPECIRVLCSIKDMRREEDNVLLPAELYDKAIEAVSDLKKLISGGQISLDRLLDVLLENHVPFPIQILVTLQQMHVMQLATYISKYAEKYGNVSWFPDCLFRLIQDDSTSHSLLLTSILSTLLAMREPGSLSFAVDMAALFSNVVEELCTQVTEWVVNLPEEGSTWSDLTYLSCVASCGEVGESSVLWFAYFHLLKLVSAIPPGGVCAANQVPKYQSSKWKLALTPAPLKSLLKEVVKIVGTDKVVRCIAESLTKSQVNWRIILLLTSSVLLFEDGGEKTFALTDQLLRRGLECDNQSDLAAAMLLARQACQEGCPNFGSYSQWFGSHFGANSATARSRDQFRSLLQLLTALVPDEPPAMLRVHLNTVPKAPTSCHALLRDYTVLARSRLDDLNVSADVKGLFGDDLDGEQDTRSKDVCGVLRHFLDTQKVLRVVMEASVVRRKWYESVFLVELLQLPGWSLKPLPPAEENVRPAFIKKLKSLEKIPERLYKAYKESCSEAGDLKQQERKPEVAAKRQHSMEAPPSAPGPGPGPGSGPGPGLGSEQKSKGRLQMKKKRSE